MKRITILFICIACSMLVFGQNPLEPDHKQSEHDYSFYKEEYKGARVLLRVGGGLMAGGSLAFLGGLKLALNNDPMSTWGGMLGVFIAGMGFHIFNVGICLFITGAVRKCKTKKVLQDMERNMKLTFGPTKHGVGLRLRF